MTCEVAKVLRSQCAMDSLESLRALRAQGVINAAEFVSLASEIAKSQAAAIGAAREHLSSLQFKVSVAKPPRPASPSCELSYFT